MVLFGVAVMPDKATTITGMVCTTVLLFCFSMWPTPYRYEKLSESYSSGKKIEAIYRINRLTGHCIAVRVGVKKDPVDGRGDPNYPPWPSVDPEKSRQEVSLPGIDPEVLKSAEQALLWDAERNRRGE